MSEDIARKTECTVRDGAFVEPCDALNSLIDNIAPGFSKKRGIAKWSLSNWRTHKPSRSYVGIVTDEFRNGFLFNFCPVCGTKIDAPFAGDNEEPTHLEGTHP